MSISSYCQIPDNYEFLDHEHKFASLGAHTVLEDGVLYVSHNIFGEFGNTFVKKAGFDQSMEVIYSHPYYQSVSEYFHSINDTNYIVLHSLWDWDIWGSGYIEIAQFGNQFEVNEYFFDWELYSYISDMAIDKNGNYWSIANVDGESLLISIKDGSILDQQPLGTGYEKIFNNAAGDIFIYEAIDNNYNIVAFNGTETTEVLSLTSPLKDHHYQADFNFLMLPNVILKYDSAFENLLQSWSIPDDIFSFSQVQIIDNEVLIVSGLQGENELIRIDNDNNYEVLTNLDHDKESIIGPLKLTDEKFLLFGTYYNASKNTPESFSDYHTRNIFIRNIDISDPPEYEGVSISLQSFIVEEIGIDTIDIIETPEDTHYVTQKIHDITLSIKNEGDEIITNADVFSSLLNSHITHLDWYIEEEILPSESLEMYYSDYSVYAISFQNAIVGLAGGNYAFNRNETSSLLVDLRSTVHEIPIHADWKVYPNPASQSIQLPASLALTEITVYHSNGQLWIYQKMDPGAALLDIARLSPGTYFVKARSTDGSIYTTRFCKS